MLLQVITRDNYLLHKVKRLSPVTYPVWVCVGCQHHHMHCYGRSRQTSPAKFAFSSLCPLCVPAYGALPNTTRSHDQCMHHYVQIINVCLNHDLNKTTLVTHTNRSFSPRFMRLRPSCTSSRVISSSPTNCWKPTRWRHRLPRRK